MNRRLWILLAAAAYLLILWAFHRIKRRHARSKGLKPEALAPFDHRGFLEELGEVHKAGRPSAKPAGTGQGGVGYAAELPDSLRPLLRELPAWFDFQAWRGDLGEVPEGLGTARDMILEGRYDEVDALVDPAQEPDVDQAFASLAIHFFIESLYRGDLDAANTLIGKLPAWTRERISHRTVEKHRAQISLLRVAREPGGRSRREALRAIRRAGGGSRYADSGTLALWAHLTLTLGRNFFLEELILIRVDMAVRRGLEENRNSSLLYYELAHVCLWRGRLEEAVDHLARALYFSGGDSFYAGPILGWPPLVRLKPALVKQARAMAERE